jgi:hypothetical protein
VRFDGGGGAVEEALQVGPAVVHPLPAHGSSCAAAFSAYAADHLLGLYAAANRSRWPQQSESLRTKKPSRREDGEEPEQILAPPRRKSKTAAGIGERRGETGVGGGEDCGFIRRGEEEEEEEDGEPRQGYETGYGLLCSPSYSLSLSLSLSLLASSRSEANAFLPSPRSHPQPHVSSLAPGRRSQPAR